MRTKILHVRDLVSSVSVVLLLLMDWVKSSSTLCPPQCRCLSPQRWKCFNASVVDLQVDSRTVRSLEINSLQFTEMDNEISVLASIRQLEIYNTTISSISEAFIKKFPNLKVVRFRKTYFDCNNRLLPLQKWIPIIANKREELLCSTPDGLSKSKLFNTLNELERVHTECPKSCTCSMYNSFSILKTEFETPNVLVNCSNILLDKLPPSLPRYGLLELDLSYNKLTQVNEIFLSSSYKNVVALNLAHNLISSIPRNNTVNHFKFLNLSFNNVTKIPSFILEKQTLLYNPLVMLSGNPWECTCNTLERFQMLAAQQLYVILDYEYVTCGGNLHGLYVSSPAVLNSLCLAASIDSSISFLYAANIFGFLLLSYLTTRVIQLCRSMYHSGELRVASQLLISKF